ncbi:MAG: nitrate reductase [Candidatus Omnitrophica bacterium]|nr:nitrate reductase [Candidatus Omnitrophota bacterium]
MLERLKKLIYQTDGKFTEELRLEESGFGLGHLPRRLRPDGVTRAVCGYCSTGCSLDVHIKDGKACNLTPTHAYPVNVGEACPKGWEALSVLNATDRATTPLLRGSDGTLKPVDWPVALKTFAERFKAVQQRHGADSVAYLSTGQITNEEMTLLGILAKFGMGIVHGDGNTRQCMATAATAYKQSFGFDAPPFTYADFEESDCLVFVGANPCIAHPIMWQRVLMNQNNPEIIVLDPRKTETAIAATQHYAVRPKSDLSLLYGVANFLIKNEWIDEDYIERHTNSFEAFSRHVEEFTLDRVSAVCGISETQIAELAALIHRSQRVSFWWMVGVNQGYEATRTAQAIINLALMTGNIGRPGTGANSITGQCNAMGSRLYSNTTNLLGGRMFTDAEHRGEIAEILGIGAERIPAEDSWAYDQIIEGVHEGKIKGLWIVATNPGHSWINRTFFEECMRKLEFLVVQDMYHSTETAQLADLVLPAAGWGEKEGTFINSERRFGLIRAVAEPPGEAKTDFEIFKLIGRAWGCQDITDRWSAPEDMFQTIKEVSRGRPCDITGIADYAMLERCGGIQWPFRPEDDETATERRLFEDGEYYHSDGRAQFMFEAVAPNPEPTCRQYPLVLLTGRGTSSQWHTQTRTGKSKILQKMCPQEVYVEINPRDARDLSIRPGQQVRVVTRRGSVKANAVIKPSVFSGQIFMPMHYPETNLLTLKCFDPYSRQPSYKSCAAKLMTVQTEKAT